MKTRSNVLAMSVGLLAGSTTCVWAQDQPTPESRGRGLEEVLVTATKTGATEIQSTPIALTVFSASQLEASRVDDIRDLVSFTPNLSVAQTSANAQIYIRGIGSNNVFNGSDPDVTMQSDGVYIARAYGQFVDFVDVERIEVLRGPQGTLYGRNAVGGTINIVSRKPSDEFEGKAQLTVGDYSLLQTQGYISGPFVPGVLQGSLAVNYLRHDDYVDNIVAGRPDVDNANRGGFRGQLRFIPSDRIEAITRFDWNRADERFDSISHQSLPLAYAPLATSLIGDFRSVALNDAQSLEKTNWGVSEDIDFALSDSLNLKSITAYRKGEYTVWNDSDGTEQTTIYAFQYDESRQFSQELNLNLQLEKWEAVFGIYYFNEHETSIIQNSTPPSVVTAPERAQRTTVAPDSHVESKAAFVQGTYHLTDEFSVTAGVRYTSDKKEVDQNFQRTSLALSNFGAILPGFPILIGTERTFSAWTPKLGVAWQASDDFYLFASATRGFKSGGTNFAGTNALTLSFEPEYIWSYEAGVKSDWLDRRLRINLTGFYYDYTDLQVQALIRPGVASIGNAAKARAQGLEIETIAQPTENLSISLNYSLLDNTYSSFENSSVPTALIPFVTGDPRFNAATGTYDATDNRLGGAPRSSVSASIQYDIPTSRGKFYGRAEYFWQDRVYYQPTNLNLNSQAPYDLTNLSVGYLDDDEWSVRVISRNVSDTEYLISYGPTAGGPAGPPRTVAVQFTKQW